MQLEQIGKYKVVGTIGKGAMGEVFRAHDPVLDRDVAIKVVAGKLAEDEDTRKRFIREAKAAARLNHPNIITVHDYGEEQGMAFIAMEILDEGHDLKDHIAKGTLDDLDAKIAIMEQICDGLAFAHEKGVVHQDLKPANIRILANGGVKIMDFGLALRNEDATPDEIMGTPYYMAPEQCMGERPTARSDVFSLGAVFYEFLSRKRPFSGKGVKDVLIAVLQHQPTPLLALVPSLPPALAAFVEKALVKEPRYRYRSGEEMSAALAAALSGEAGRAASDEGPSVPTDTSPARPLGPALSASPATDPALFRILAEINQYLDDVVPPLMVVDSVYELQNAPVDGTAAEILGWAERKQTALPEFTTTELVFHALRKLNVIGELNLVEKQGLLGFLKTVGAAVASACEPVARQRLRRLLERLGEEDLSSVLPARGAPGRDTDEGPVSRPSTLQTRQLSILEQRLRQEGLGKAPASDPVRRRVVSMALSAAATAARSERELKYDLRRLRSAGVAAEVGQVFRGLGAGLGNWALPYELAALKDDISRAPEVAAMERIVSLPDDPIEVARRFHQLVTAATEQFNEGHLGRAVQMIELARQLVDEKKVEAGYVEPIRKRGHEALDPARLREFMEKPDRHLQLREMMEFFDSGLGVNKLLGEVELEERRDRRRLLLDLLVIHGEPARTAARQLLWDSAETEVSDFARRNWIYLLRMIPRADEDPVDPEVEAAARFGVPGMPLFLAKEAVSFLGQIRNPSAGRALITLLNRWKSFLTQGEIDEASRNDGFGALDRIASAIARQGYPQGWAALVDHALGRRPELGATIERLADLGSQDLSQSPEAVDRLLEEIEDSLPRGVLGRLVGRKDQDLPALVGALAGTRTPEVQQVLGDVAERLGAQAAGQAAERAMRPTPAVTPSASGMSGEIDPDTLPSLLHRLSTDEASGTLILRPADGAEPATLIFVRGRVVAARWDRREGLSAVYQIFQRPFLGTFAFDGKPPAVSEGVPALAETGPLLRECIRRARDVERTSALLPDVIPLESSGDAPSTVPDEPDYQLVVALWEKACSKVTVAQMEEELTVDAYRIRHALAHWLQEGALRLMASAAPEPPPPAEPSATGT